MKKIIFIRNTILVIYFLFTLLYSLPKNPIRVYNPVLINFFDVFLQQRWDFFAPPPQSNNKMYFSFFDKNMVKMGTFEVLSPIMKQKRITIPFNTNSESLDYIISGQINEILSSIVKKNNELKYKYKSKLNSENYNNARRDILKKINKNNSFKTLVNFSTIICRKNIKKSNEVKFVKILITEKKINKFIDRFKISKEENLLIETDILDYGFFK
jgi:hypothetical protein